MYEYNLVHWDESFCLHRSIKRHYKTFIFCDFKIWPHLVHEQFSLTHFDAWLQMICIAAVPYIPLHWYKQNVSIHDIFLRQQFYILCFFFVGYTTFIAILYQIKQNYWLCQGCAHINTSERIDSTPKLSVLTRKYHNCISQTTPWHKRKGPLAHRQT